jgi:outer membrane protein, multidrug efflux system
MKNLFWLRVPTGLRRAGTLCVPTALLACGSIGPLVDSPAPLAIPTEWSIADAAGAGASGVSEASLAVWWQRFDDPQLEVLVMSALRANTSIQNALGALRQAQALRDVAAAALWPRVDAPASAQRGTAGGHNTGNNFQIGADLNWAIDVSGALRAGVAAAEAGAAASEASLGDVQVQIAAEVALNYILLRTGQVRTVIAIESLASREETLQITLWRQQAGLVTMLDVEQARTAVEQNRAQLPALQTSILQTQHALAVLTGQAPGALPELVGVRSAEPSVPQVRGGVAPSVPAQVLRQRADVRAAEYRVAAALSRVGQAHAQRLPRFAISGSLALGAATVGALGASSAVLGSLLASVTLPVTDGGALRAQVRVQAAVLAQAEQTYRAAVLAALQQVEDALVALRGDRLRLASLRLAADAASNAAVLARQRYSSGLIDFQSVLETQRTQFAAQDAVASASADVGSNHVRLFKALGGGWASPFGAQDP